MSHMVYLGFLGSHPLTILPKYVGQFVMTCWLLIRHRPTAVIVMSPPLFAAIAPLVYGWLFRRPFAMDCHTAAFTHPRFKRLQWLQHWLERRASVNIVHNEALQALVEDHGGKTVLVKDVPVVYQETEHYPLSEGFNVAAVCSFNPDEPIEAIVGAARNLPDIRFYLTGNPRHLASDVLDSLPENLVLTGFISDAAYGDLIRRADVVMSLTTRDHTMLRGAWEAIYQGTPVIVSDWPVLKESFSQGAIHVDNSPESIAAAISNVRDHAQTLNEQADLARQGRLTRWDSTKQELLSHMLPM
ncbi:MAG: glycosyltransferase family 4 protein [Planctomycetaceae bacterium]|nr:glycosyltransferase family 4 protein [Planctomycetaceae bacterium]